MTKDTSSQEYLDLKAELRSILISSQQGCNEQQLLRDYATYNARKEIPYRDMGYKSLIELLTSMPDVARIDQTRIPVNIHGVADQNTVHIKNFVMTQKRKKPTRNMRGGMNRYSYGNNSVNRMNGSSTYPRNRQVSFVYSFLAEQFFCRNSNMKSLYILILTFLVFALDDRSYDRD
jgi:hypothetical protein